MPDGFKKPRAGLINVEVSDQTGVRRMLMVRFPRAKLAFWTVVAIVLIFGLPWLIRPFYNYGELWWFPWVLDFVLAVLFGWLLVGMVIVAVRGGYLALTQSGVLIQTGLSSVLIPWSEIKTAAAGKVKVRHNSNPVLRLSLRSDDAVQGWSWHAALSPVLGGSSRRNLQIYAWWFQPVPVDRIVAIVRYLASHPEEHPRIGSADPDEWLLAPRRQAGVTMTARSSSGDGRGDWRVGDPGLTPN